ncbi:MAG: NUDIX hydrolase [Nitrospinota bacterium]
MGREYPLRPIVGVGAIILNGEDVLVVRRGRPPREGYWSVPGGAVKLGETLEEACQREVIEETGLTVELLARCAVLDRVTRDEWARVRFHYVLVDYLCRPVGGSLRAGGDISEAKWHPLDTLPQLQPMTPGTAEVILEAAAGHRRGAPAG